MAQAAFEDSADQPLHQDVANLITGSMIKPIYSYLPICGEMRESGYALVD